MDSLLQKLKSNWEYGVAALVLFVTLAILGSFFLFGNDKKLDTFVSGGEISSNSMLSDGALDFLTKESPTVRGNDPFKLPIDAPKAPKPKPKPAPKPVPKPAPVKEAPHQKVVEEAPKGPVIVQATAKYVMKGNMAARPMAILALSFTDGSTERVRLGIGEGKYELKVLAIGDEQIKVQDAKKKQVILLKEKKTKLYLKK